MPVVQQPAPEQLARPPAGPKARGGDTVEELADRFPFLCRYARIQDRVFRPESRLTPSSFHGSPLAGDAPTYRYRARATVRQVSPVGDSIRAGPEYIRTMRRTRQLALECLLAVAVTAAAVVATRAIQPLVSPSITPLFILAVAIASLYGGRGAGALACVLSVAALSYWFLEPTGSFHVRGGGDIARQLLFLAVAGVTVWIAGGVHAQRSQAVRHAEEHERLRQLAEEAASEAEAAAQEAAEGLATQLQAEKALRDREAELADFFETASTAMHWVGRDGTILRANQAELDLLGYERDEYIGRNISEFHVDPPVIDDILHRLLGGQRLRQYPARLRCKDGQVKEVVIDSSVYFDESRFVHTRCFTRDVTAEREAQEAMARLAAIVASSADAIIGKTLDGIITSWNAAAEHVFGYSAAEMVGESVFKLIPPELHPVERDLLQRLRRGEVVEASEARRVRKDGGEIWIALSVSPIRDASGAITGAASIKRDITRQREAEAELRQNQEQLQLAHQAARMGTWRWDVATNVLRWDAGLRQLYGLTDGEQVSGYDDFIARVHPDDRERVSQSVQQALGGRGALDYEFRIVLPDGRVRWLADLGRVTMDSSGRPLYLTGICMDVTERKAVEDHLRDTQRLQAVGQLAGGIAHEANNQMSVVLGGAHFLLRRTDLPEAARQDIEQIRQAAERTASITQQLLAFSRRQILQLQDVDLNAVVQSMAPVLRRSLAEHQTLVFRLGLLNGPVRADPRQLEQVLLNLTLNARDAMPDGGRLTIETGEVELTAGDTGDGGPPPGAYEMMVVEDSGHGIEPGTLERIFEPFFTTKEVGQGTGLGLPVVHGIVSQLGGHIRVETAPGHGTKFKLYFSVAHESRSVAPAEVVPPVPRADGAVALLVEDDAEVRAMAARALREVGYRVLEAENGRAALDLVRGHAGRLDLVVTDVGMPEMDGYDLARCLSVERADVPVVFMSGYGDQDARAHVSGLTRSFLRKPVSPDALVRAAGEAVNGNGR
jgi:two-component system, cell cycle sensor histidine kinase and response regulator CckA